MREGSWNFFCWVSLHHLKTFADTSSLLRSTHKPVSAKPHWFDWTVKVWHAKHCSHNCTSYINLVTAAFAYDAICKSELRCGWNGAPSSQALGSQELGIDCQVDDKIYDHPQDDRDRRLSSLHDLNHLSSMQLFWFQASFGCGVHLLQLTKHKYIFFYSNTGKYPKLSSCNRCHSILLQ